MKQNFQEKYFNYFQQSKIVKFSLKNVNILKIVPHDLNFHWGLYLAANLSPCSACTYLGHTCNACVMLHLRRGNKILGLYQ